MEHGLDLSAPIKTQVRVNCIQQGTVKEHTGDIDLEVIVMAQEGEET